MNDDQFIALWQEAHNNGYGLLWVAGEMGVTYTTVQTRGRNLRANGVELPDMRVGGGRLAASTNKLRYGNQFYSTIGKLGGKKSRGGGFASNPQLAREAGRRGGVASRRGRA